MNNTIETKLKHDPLYVRRTIVILSAILSFMAFIFGATLFQLNILPLVLYPVIATALDFAFSRTKGMKSSDHVDAERLLAENEATPEQLDAYSASRRQIRYISLAVGVMFAIISLLLIPQWFQLAFFAGYLITTAIGVYTSKIDIKNKFPPAFVRDDSMYEPGRPTAGGVSVGMYSAGQSTGVTYGPIDPNR